jgi:hypothetical protein
MSITAIFSIDLCYFGIPPMDSLPQILQERPKMDRFIHSASEIRIFRSVKKEFPDPIGSKEKNIYIEAKAHGISDSSIINMLPLKSWKRGSIVLLYSKNSFESVASALSGAVVRFPSSLNQIRTVNTSSAINSCLRWVAESDGFAICCPASNGVEWLDVFVSFNVFQSVKVQEKKIGENRFLELATEGKCLRDEEVPIIRIAQ